MGVRKFLYTGHVPRAGFRWVDARPARTDPQAQPQRFLVPLSRNESEPQSQSYNLLDLQVVLFKVFAETARSEEAILAFANSYGSLGVGVAIELATTEGSGPGKELRGEPYLAWLHQISDMLQLSDLWDLCRARDVTRLARHIIWEQDQIFFRSHVPLQEERKEGGRKADTLGYNKTQSVISSAETNPELLRQVEPGDVLYPAMLYLQRRLDEHLSSLRRSTTPRLTWPPEKGEPSLQFEATNLSTALWLQLADAVVNNQAFTRCSVCRKWLEVSPAQARAHRRFCSDACRVKAYRDRQDDARRMFFEENKSIEEIAKELDSREKTIKRWIKGK